MDTRRDLMQHFRYLREAIRSVGGEAYCNIDTWTVELRIGNVLHRLRPKFIALRDGKLAYVESMAPDVVRFAGWNHRAMPEPFSFGKKLVFKQLLERLGYATPMYSTASADDMSGVLIKGDISSFSTGIRGPFNKPPGLNTEAGEFYEKFVPGKIAKIWYVNQRPVCMELKPMPSVTGDGRSTISELVAREPKRFDGAPNLDHVSELLAFFGKELTSVLPSGTLQIIDFRYTSQFDRPEVIEELDFQSSRIGRFENELWRLGESLNRQLLEENFGDAVFSVDAILDASDKLWYLEANPNPFVHPRAYALIIQLLKTRKAGTKEPHRAPKEIVDARSLRH